MGQWKLSLYRMAEKQRVPRSSSICRQNLEVLLAAGHLWNTAEVPLNKVLNPQMFTKVLAMSWCLI